MTREYSHILCDYCDYGDYDRISAGVYGPTMKKCIVFTKFNTYLNSLKKFKKKTAKKLFKCK